MWAGAATGGLLCGACLRHVAGGAARVQPHRTGCAAAARSRGNTPPALPAPACRQRRRRGGVLRLAVHHQLHLHPQRRNVWRRHRPGLVGAAERGCVRVCSARESRAAGAGAGASWSSGCAWGGQGRRGGLALCAPPPCGLALPAARPAHLSPPVALHTPVRPCSRHLLGQQHSNCAACRAARVQLCTPVPPAPHLTVLQSTPPGPTTTPTCLARTCTWRTLVSRRVLVVGCWVLGAAAASWCTCVVRPPA